MTSRRVVRPDSLVWPVNNIFQGKDITPDIDVKEAVRVSIEPPPFAFLGMRWYPVLHITPPDAHGYKIEWYFDGQPITLSIEGSFYLQRIGQTSLGLQVKITNPDGEVMVSDPMPINVQEMQIALQTPIPAEIVNTDPPFQIKPVVVGLDYPFPVPGMVTTYKVRDPAYASVDAAGVVTLKANVTTDIKIDVNIDFLGVKWAGTFTLHQVKLVPLTGLSFLVPSFDDLRVGATVTAALTRTPADTTVKLDDITFTVNKPGYVQINTAGLANPSIKALAESATPITITASYGGFSTVFTLPTIKPAFVHALSYTIDPIDVPPSGFRVGDKVTLHATVTPANATFTSYFWTSSNSAAVKITPTTTNGPTAIMEFLQTGSGATISVIGEPTATKGTFVTGQVNPKPTPPPAIDMTTETLDQRVTVISSSAPYFDTDNKLKWAGADTWPMQYKSGLAIGRALMETANVNRITKPHFDGANLTNQAGTDTWRYTSGTNPAWGATNGVDGEMGAGAVKWFNVSRVVQDGVAIKPATSAYDGSYAVGINHYNGKTVLRLVLRFNVPSPAVTETRVDFIVSNSGGNVDMITYSYKELEPGDYVLSIYRTENTAGDRWVYSMPQLNKATGARAPTLGTVIADGYALIESNADVPTLRLTLTSVSDGTTKTRDIDTGRAQFVKLQADGADNWGQYVLTKIEYIIP